MSAASRKIVFLLLILAVLAPPAFIISAIQYSAITYPFWDHVELLKFIAKYHQGTLTFADLVSAHNQTRPLTYRSIYLFNAILTDWDIRSEYIYMYATLLATWAAHLFVAWRILGRRLDFYVLMVFLVISIVLFSPVGHNNHWWSMMLQLDLTNLLITVALFTVALRPRSWSAHLVAVVAAWLAAYTLTNGIFAFLVIIATLKLADRPFYSLKPDRFLLFWLANMAVLSIVYFPGIPVSSGIPHPSIPTFIHFTLAYLGNPVGALLWFPFVNQFNVPASTALNTALGVVLCVLALASLRTAWSDLRERRPEALILFLFVGLAVLSAMATAWGRAAFDASGVANANSSRYSIFAAYLPLGLFFYHAVRFRPGAPAALGRPGRGLALATVTTFVAASGVSYARALPIYEHSRVFNSLLSDAYTPDGFAGEHNRLIYPIPSMVLKVKTDLLLLGLGPYRFNRGESVRLAAGPATETLRVAGGQTAVQRFVLDTAGLQALRLPISGEVPAGQTLDWTLSALTDNGRAEITKGSIDVQAGVPVIVPLKRMSGCHAHAQTAAAPCRDTLELTLRPGLPDGVGFTRHQSPDEDVMPAVTVDGVPAPSGAVLDVDAIYTKSRT
ncbi:hypothetical protein [Azospirillum argentinense]